MVSVRVLLLLCQTALQTVWAVPLPSFLPIGPDSGDFELQRGNDVSASVNLAATIPFLGMQRDTITVRALSVASVCACYIPAGYNESTAGGADASVEVHAKAT